MKEFKNKVAVITGAASGIGKGIAEKCSSLGMKVVIADIEEVALIKTEKELKELNPNIISVVTDVSKIEEVKALAEKTIEKYGAVHLLFNNAGVGTAGPISNQTLKTFQWVVGVNLWGVIYGMQVFLPIMIEQNDHCHIINTSSAAGVIPSLGVYGITKFGVTALTEMYASEFKSNNSKVKISVVYPGIVNTNIVDSHRNRPEALRNPEIQLEPKMMAQFELVYKAAKEFYNGPNSMSTQTVADIIFNGIENDILFIFTDLSCETAVNKRAEAMLRDLDVLKRFIKKSGRTREEFHSEAMEEGYKASYSS